MEREQALRELADVYAVALRLRDRGLPDAEIADIVGIDARAVESHLRIADAKLARLMEPSESAATPSEHRGGT